MTIRVTVPSGPDWLEEAGRIREYQRLCEHLFVTKYFDAYREGRFRGKWEVKVCVNCGKEIDRKKIEYGAFDEELRWPAKP